MSNVYKDPMRISLAKDECFDAIPAHIASHGHMDKPEGFVKRHLRRWLRLRIKQETRVEVAEAFQASGTHQFDKAVLTGFDAPYVLPVVAGPSGQVENFYCPRCKKTAQAFINEMRNGEIVCQACADVEIDSRPSNWREL